MMPTLNVRGARTQWINKPNINRKTNTAQVCQQCDLTNRKVLCVIGRHLHSHIPNILHWIYIFRLRFGLICFSAIQYTVAIHNGIFEFNAVIIQSPKQIPIDCYEFFRFILIHFPFHVSIFSLEFLYKYADIANKNRIQRMFCVKIKIIFNSLTQFLLLAKIVWIRFY